MSVNTSASPWLRISLSVETLQYFVTLCVIETINMIRCESLRWPHAAHLAGQLSCTPRAWHTSCSHDSRHVSIPCLQKLPDLSFGPVTAQQLQQVQWRPPKPKVLDEATKVFQVPNMRKCCKPAVSLTGLIFYSI